MNPSDVQSETEPRYFDPEEIDMSEQQFAASLDAESEKPQFEIDEPELEDPVAGELAKVQEEAVAKGESGEDVPPSEGVLDGTGTQTESRCESDWRSVVSAKVSSYKARKPHKERYPSLKLQFEPPAPRMSPELRSFAPVEEGGQSLEEPVASLAEPIPLIPAALNPPPRVVMESTARIIEFPRPAMNADELADPVIERPRIVEAPELLPPPPAMGGILIEEELDSRMERRPGFDVPLQSASLNRRVAAGLLDVALVMIAVALFGYVFARINSGLPDARSAVLLILTLLGTLWSVYQYAFLVHSGRTPGLWATRLHLARFDGHRASRGLRRWRVLASLLSLLSLGLGYVWCFLDEDQLSWHDRITKTHLAP